jgi:hypothetical protein
VITSINSNTKGRKREFFLYMVMEDILRVNVPIDKIEALREQEMNEGVEADAETFKDWLIAKGYKASIATPIIDKVLE